MSEGLIVFLVIYAVVGFGATLGTVPRAFFRHPVERFIVRVSCGLIWPMFAGYLLMHRIHTTVNDQ